MLAERPKLGLTVDNMISIARRAGDPLAPFNIRVLDPGVGTGTFLTLYIQRLGEYIKREFGDELDSKTASETLKRIVSNVVGFDLDALAIMTARANYLIAFASIGVLAFKEGGSIEIPIYMANSIVPAEMLVRLREESRDREKTGTVKVYNIPTSVGVFQLPAMDRDRLEKTLETVAEWLGKRDLDKRDRCDERGLRDRVGGWRD